jgi:hypothetical protein
LTWLPLDIAARAADSVEGNRDRALLEDATVLDISRKDLSEISSF